MNPLESPTLRAQLSDAARWDAEYGHGLSSHLPMALVALARLGADDARREAFARTYAQRLHAAPPIEPWPAGDAWRARLGQPRAWPSYRHLWREWIEHEGATDVLQVALPVLLQGAGAAAFHGPIRVAYALAANHADELADALAYWACRWFACGRAGTGEANGDSASVLAALDGIEAEIAPARLIAVSMAHAAAHPRFAPTIARWRVDAHTTLPRLAQLAAERYAVQGGFTALHLVTGTHALAGLLLWLAPEDRPDALRDFAGAAAAAWATLPPAGDPQAGAGIALRAWPEIVERALASDDEHVVKLVDSCRELEAAQGGPVWRRAASRAVALGA